MRVRVTLPEWLARQHDVLKPYVVDGEIVRDSDKAVLFSGGALREIWLPKSQITIHPMERAEQFVGDEQLRDMGILTRPLALWVEDNRIWVQAGKEFRNDLKKIEGAWWEGGERCWTFPLRGSIAQQIMELFHGFDVNVDDDIVALLQPTSEVAHIAPEKPLPPIPHVKVPLWRHQQEAFWFAAACFGGIDTNGEG